MSDTPPKDGGREAASVDPGASDPFEPLLAECIDAHASGGADAVEAVMRRHPDVADRLRERLASLQRLGLLGEEREGFGPRSFGAYRVLRRLGQGGMSDVFLAWDERLQRRVALKACHAPAGADERVRARFAQEIHAVAQLQHPCIVRIFDVGEEHGRPFFTMEHVEGATLAQVVEALRARDEPLPQRTGASTRELVREIASATSGDDTVPGADDPWPRTWIETACRWMLDVANALAHAHAAGIVHRDVKPSNVMIGLDGRARLFDLGLARLADRPGLTRSGDFTGTPYYVSPEQLVGRHGDVDGRSDVFSLGVSFYELLTLRRPFDGRSTAQVFRQIVDHDPLPPRRLEPEIPADLETICLTALEKNPDHRYAGVGEMAADLARFLEFAPVRARSVGGLRRVLRVLRRRPALGAAAALALLVAIGLPLGLLWANQAIRSERDVAERHAQQAEQNAAESDRNAAEATRQAELNDRVVGYLVNDVFHLTPEQSERADTVTAREILDRGAARIPTGFEDQPLVRASLMRANGLVYRNLGLVDEALPLLDRSLAIFQRELGEFHVDTATLLVELAELHRVVGNDAVALALFRRGLAAFEQSLDPDHEAALRSRIALAELVTDPVEREQARDDLAEALRRRRDAGGEPSEGVADLTERIGIMAAEDGDLEAAREHLQHALAIRRALWVPVPGALARGIDELAAVHDALGESARARELRGEALRLRAGAADADPLDASVHVAGGVARQRPSPFELRPPWRDAFDAAFQQGITALQSGRYDASAEAFERCLQLAPGHTVSDYNLACGRALAGDVEGGLHWVSRAIDDGFGFLVDGVSVMSKDPDLDALRGDPSWPALMSRMASMREQAAAYAAEPARHVPPALAGADAVPLLVVLHADGSTKDRVVSGPWRDVADELGMALLAPSAGTPTAGDPQRGMRWFREVDDYLQRPADHEAPVIEAVRRFCQDHEVDRRAVFIAGEGFGALLAANLAFEAPGLFRGLLVVNGPFQPGIAGDEGRVAASLGLGMTVLLDDAAPFPGRPPGVPLPELATDLRGWIAAWGITGADVQLVDDAGEPARHRADALAALAARLERYP